VDRYDRSVLQKFVDHLGTDKYGNPKAICCLTAMQVERYFVQVIQRDNPAPSST
jgi:hypothetical protein